MDHPSPLSTCHPVVYLFLGWSIRCKWLLKFGSPFSYIYWSPCRLQCVYSWTSRSEVKNQREKKFTMETFSQKNSPSRGSSSPSINSTDPGQFLTYSRDCSCIQGTVHVFKGLLMYSRDCSCILGTVHVFKWLSVKKSICIFHLQWYSFLLR